MAKVLVVEDNPSNMKLTVLLLSREGHEVLQAGDAEMGLVMMREHLPNLVLMDIQLPGMDGLTATRMIKADPALTHIPVVALTAHAMKGDEKHIIEAGCDSYLAKPFLLAEFLTMIKQSLK